MSRQPIPLIADDISALARALGRQLREHPTPPGHLALMNMLARAAGYQNHQHVRAVHGAALRLARPAPVPQPAPPVDHRRVERAVKHFDMAGRLARWPSRRAVQDLTLWALWAALPPQRAMPEAEMNRRLNDLHAFGDAAILRRSLVNQGHFTRNRDGSDYRRVERPPPPEARALLSALKARRGG